MSLLLDLTLNETRPLACKGRITLYVSKCQLKLERSCKTFSILFQFLGPSTISRGHRILFDMVKRNTKVDGMGPFNVIIGKPAVSRDLQCHDSCNTQK